MQQAARFFFCVDVPAKRSFHARGATHALSNIPSGFTKSVTRLTSEPGITYPARHTCKALCTRNACFACMGCHYLKTLQSTDSELIAPGQAHIACRHGKAEFASVYTREMIAVGGIGQIFGAQYKAVRTPCLKIKTGT